MAGLDQCQSGTQPGSAEPRIVREPLAPASAPSLALASSCSGAEQLGLGGGEFGVGQDTLLMQGGELVQLVDHRRGLGRGRCGLVGLRRRLLLFELADALVLVRLGLTLLLRPPAHAPSRDVRAAAHHSRTQQRPSSSKHWCLPGRLLLVPGLFYGSSGKDRPRATMSSGAAATVFGPPTCGATAISTPIRSAGVAPASSALATCHR